MTVNTEQICWIKIIDHCDAPAGLSLSEDDHVYLVVNEYMDPPLKERKKGRLICLSPDGGEKWNFAFPDFNYLYFNSGVVLYQDALFVTAGSDQLYDRGFERGLYAFTQTGQFKWCWPRDGLLQGFIADDTGNIYLGDIDGIFYRIDADDGYLLEEARSLTVLGKPLSFPKTTITQAQQKMLAQLHLSEIIGAYAGAKQGGVVILARKGEIDALVVVKIK